MQASAAADLKKEIDGICAWLFDAALPLWSTKGFDPATGGFAERFLADGAPEFVPVRARVQTRQIFTFSVAGRLGWGGPWRRMVEQATGFYLRNFLRADGAFRFSYEPAGAGDETPYLYEQAFSLLALAEAVVALERRDDVRDVARRLAGEYIAGLRNPSGGFRETADRPYQSNPHMHLLEAALAWERVDDDPMWRDLADEIVELASTKFIDRQGGFLREFFNSDWSPASGEAGRIVEPGHQFEWAWLLRRWSIRRDRPELTNVARRLFEIGAAHGVDRSRDVAVDVLDIDLKVVKPTARLWPQTERIKAAVIMSEAPGADAERCVAEANSAINGLRRYLQTPVPGMWRDSVLPDGALADGPAPATSFYHIIAAIDELVRWRDGRPPN